jgi:multiple sugar transport system ATP-binding protein
MSVYDNMAFGLKLRHTPKAEIRKRVEEAARMLDITPLLARKPKALSGGQRQRVAMGRAIVRNPQVFLFDEPLSNLDAKLRVQMRTEIKKVHQIVPTTTVYVTHDQVEAMTLADRVVVMNAGRIEQVGPPQELYHRPVSRFVAGFIGSPGMNFIPGQLEGAGDGVAIRLSADTLLPIPASRAAAYKGLSNRAMIFGIRPEHLTDTGGAGAPGFAPLTAQADVVEPMGMETMVHLLLGGAPVTARCSPVTSAAPGAPLTLWADMNQMHLMDAESGRVI